MRLGKIFVSTPIRRITRNRVAVCLLFISALLLLKQNITVGHHDEYSHLFTAFVEQLRLFRYRLRIAWLYQTPLANGQLCFVHDDDAYHP